MVIHTPRLCGEPLFLAAGTSINKPVSNIECKPVIRDSPSSSLDVEGKAPLVQEPDRSEETSDVQSTEAASSKEPHQTIEIRQEDDYDLVILLDEATGEVLSTEALDPETLDNGQDGEQTLEGLAKAIQRSLQTLNVEDDHNVDGQSHEERLATIVKALFGGKADAEQNAEEEAFQPRDPQQQQGSRFVGSSRQQALRDSYHGQHHEEEEESKENGEERSPDHERDEL